MSNVIELVTIPEEKTLLKPYQGYEAEFEYTQKLLKQQLSKDTRRAYNSDWRIFKAWCENRHFTAESATHEIVSLFLGSQFSEGVHPSTLKRRLAAIKFAFTCRQLPSPTDHPIVSAILQGIKRDPEAPPVEQKKAATTEIISEILKVIPDTLWGIRDKAALLMGFGGAYRRSELIATNLEDITFIPGKGMDALVKRSKTDQEGEGRIKAIYEGERYCPIEAVKAWIEAAQITDGPLFRGITSGGKVKTTHLSASALYYAIQRHVKKAGFATVDYSPHSLRAGFITSAAEREKDLFKIMDVSFHVDPRSIKTYVRHANRYKNHAGKGLL